MLRIFLLFIFLSISSFANSLDEKNKINTIDKIIVFVNKTIITSNQLNNQIALMQKTLSDYLFDVFGLKPVEENIPSKMDDVMNVLIDIRKEAKVKKDFSMSDAIRNKLQEVGIQLKDEKDGSVSWSSNQ